jgi:uncharacterized protein YcbX
MGVLAIWRYPVKAMLGQELEWADVSAGGLEGDRRWVLADTVTGALIANKRGPTDERLRACRARIDGGGELVVTLPDGTTVSGVLAVAGALSELLGRRLVLVEHPGGGEGFVRTGGHHDFAPVHVMTTRSLAHMRSVAPASDWDVRRFRPNVVFDDGTAPGALAERELVGRELRGPSGVRLRVGLPTPRCVVPTRAREELPGDPRLLKHLAAESRWDLGPFGRPVCLGAYAEVSRGGRLAVGERVAVGPRAAASADAAVADAVERVVASLPDE